MPVFGWLTAALCLLAGAGLVWLHAGWILPRIPEPALPPSETDGKLPYRQIASWRFIGGCLLASVPAMLIAAAQPVEQRFAWVVLGSGVLVLVGVDLRSTWLPRLLQRWCTAELVLAVLIGALLIWHAHDVQSGWRFVLAATLGGAAAWALFWLVWRLTRGGLGFGDVRLVSLLGATAALSGQDRWWVTLLAGCLAGLIWGLASRLVTGRRHFPYGPALWLGAYLALLVPAGVLG